ncbi:MAG: alpha/beta hydrolase, partial [Clostridia bacterium]|nr:alpha/beta hydrolase [Clostridia bacterium]
MEESVLYIHGKGGSAREAEHYAPLFPGARVSGIDYRAETPWDAMEEFPALIRKAAGTCPSPTVIVN